MPVKILISVGHKYLFFWLYSLSIPAIKKVNKNENGELDAENSAAAASVYQSRGKYADGTGCSESDASSMYTMRGENFLFEKLNGK